MSKIVRKGVAKDGSYIAFELQCKNGIDTYVVRFKVAKEQDIFVGYGCYVRTPDFEITIKDKHYKGFWADGKNIKIPHDDKHGEYEGVCYEFWKD